MIGISCRICGGFSFYIPQSEIYSVPNSRNPIFRRLNKEVCALGLPFPVHGKGGIGPDLTIQNYEDIGIISVREQNYLHQTRSKNIISIG